MYFTLPGRYLTSTCINYLIVIGTPVLPDGILALAGIITSMPTILLYKSGNWANFNVSELRVGVRKTSLPSSVLTALGFVYLLILAKF